jgi:bifunctional enzyme CysN/CysC
MTTPALEAFLRENENKELLRFSTAGSIDDGKSTLIGRLLHDSKSVYEDVLASVKKASTERHFETEVMDFSLLTDGLKAEREQGITIDVAYRYFSTPKRKFIIADTPGHEQYTRNMATGASTANLSIVLIDARNGVLPQTKRHAFIASLLGVPHLVVAVNKMDAVGYDRAVYDRIRAEFEDFSRKLSTVDVRFIPISALKGDNVVHRSPRMPWYEGESLLELLETVYIGSDVNLIDLRFPVQLVLRPNMDFRGYAGQLVSGVIRKGDAVMALPSRAVSRVKSIVTFDGELDEAYPPMSVVVTLEDERDISRGDMLVHVHNQPRLERHFECMLVWMSDAPMDPARAYLIKHTTQVTRMRVDEVRYKVDVNTLNRVAADRLTLNEIGRIVFTAHKPLFYDPYTKNRGTGSFILIDPISNGTVAAGMIIDREPADNLPSRITGGESGADLHPGRSRISSDERAARLRQRPATLWLTGLAGSGKMTAACGLERRLFDLGATAVVLDGSSLRLGLSRELDFSGTGRAEHLRRAAETARLLNDAGLIVIAAFVSPDRDLRRQVREIVGEERFLEVFLDAPVAVCEARDPGDVYRKARDGRIATLPGVNTPYEPPEAPDLVLPTAGITAAESVERLLALLKEKLIFPRPEEGATDERGA